MHIAPLTPTIGAEVSGIDIGALDEADFGAVHKALLEHQVLAFRDQDLSPQAHIAFAERFGEIDVYPFTSKNVTFSSHPSGLDGLVRLEHDESRPAYENVWHIDMTWRAKPPRASILRAVELPDNGGGDTLFASTGAVYESFDTEMQKTLDNMSVDHDWIGSFGMAMPPEMLAEFRTRLPRVTHPMIATHPDTGRRGLFIGGVFAEHISGMGRAGSRSWLDFINGFYNLPEVQCRVRWSPGTVVMWDNRAVAHYAVNDYYPQTRIMDRVTIAGDAPT